MPVNGAGRHASPADLALAVLAAAPFAIDYSGSLCDYADLPQRVFVSAALPAALAAWAWRARRDGGADVSLRPWHGAAAAFLLWCALTGLWSRAGLEWWLEWRHWLLAGAAGAAAAAGGRPSPWALWAFFGSAVATAAFAVLQYFSVPPFSLVLQAVPPSATFGHRSFAMHWLVLGAPLGVALWARAAAAAPQWAAALGCGLVAGTAVLASARASWLGGAASAALLGLWVALELRRGPLPGAPAPRWASAAAGVLLAAGLAGAARSDYSERYGSRSTRLAAMVTGLSGAPETDIQAAAIPANNVRMRLAIWRNSLAIAAARPLRGVGLGNFQVHYPWFSRRVVFDGVDRENLHVDHAHNDPYQLLLEAGAVGVLLAGLGLLLALSGARSLWRSEDLGERAAAAGLAAGAAGILVTSLFCLPFHRALPPTAFAVFLGCLAAGAGGRAVRLTGGALTAVLAVAAAASAGLAYFGVRTMAGDAYYGRANGSILVLRDHPQAPPGVSQEEWALRRARVLRTIYDDARAAVHYAPTPYSHYTLGAVLAQIGRHDEALVQLAAFTQRRPNHFRALVNLALVLTAKGRVDEALQVAGRAANIRPESAKAQSALGSAQARKGLLREAAASFGRAAAAAPKDPLPAFRLGLALRELGDEPAARGAFAEALRRDPGFAEAGAALAARRR